MQTFAIILAAAGVAFGQAVTTLVDGQPQVPTAYVPITSIVDHQPQIASTYVPITTIADHQPQVASTYIPITTIYDHQPQVGTPVSVAYTPTPVESPPSYTGAANAQKVLGAAGAGVAAIAGLVLA